MFCSKCGAPNPSDAVFCENCGHPISGPSAFTENAAAPYAPAPPALEKKRWPAVLPILFGVVFLMEIYFLVDFFKFLSVYGFAHPSTLSALIHSVVTFIFTALVLLFFILPTRTTPFLTAIPRILSMLLAVFSIVTAAVGHYLDSNSVPMIAMGMIAVVFYIIDTAARPHGKALAILHAVFAGAVVAGAFMDKIGSISGLINAIQTMILNVGFIIALFVMARRPKKAKA
ncbi:MAG: zinc-ribbon domain-containing protein [Clostridiales bacterium]|nr:zinc-ribbon domain-containing protein [Clostridiales bacterium]